MTEHRPALLAKVLRRSGERCEECNAVNGALGYVDPAGRLRTCSRADVWQLNRFPDLRPRFLRIRLDLAWDGADPSTARAACQRCLDRGAVTPYPPF